jgi:glycosyltransferase involved in cell wall biosynthesis
VTIAPTMILEGESKPSPSPAPPTLSVILPNYNHAKLIGRALGALLSQDRAADEIIVVDDGSTDDSVAVVERIAATASSIRLLQNPRNLGVAPTSQAGLEVARGKYVYFAAADDWVVPGFFGLALRRLEADPDLGLFCGEAILLDGLDSRPFAVRPAVRPRMSAGRINPGTVKQLLRATDNWILTGSAVFRRDCVVWAGGLDPRLGTFADGYIARKIALRFGLFFEPKPVAYWVIFPESGSRRVALELERAIRMLDLAPAVLAADPIFPTWYAEAFRNRWRFATCRLALLANPIDRTLVLEIGPRSAAEKARLKALLSLPGRKLVQLVVLAWLWYQLRPTSLLALLRTMLAMRTLRVAAGFRLGGKRHTGSATAGSGTA